MPRIPMIINNKQSHNNYINPTNRLNLSINKGNIARPTTSSISPMKLNLIEPMINRIANLKPGCGSCGRK